MRLISPIARVRIADDEFISGDRFLKFCSVELGEDSRATNCRFEVYDPGMTLAEKYMAISFEQGGIIVPDDLLKDPKKGGSGGSAAGATPATVTASGATGTTSSTDLTPEVRAFLDAITLGEGTSGPNGYRINVGGTTFDSLADHPRRYVAAAGSDAAGRYQFLSTTWDEEVAKLGLKDFSEKSQDIAAVSRLKYRGVYDLVVAGKWKEAIDGNGSAGHGANWEWASLPGSPYGQRTENYDAFYKVYAEALARYKGSSPPKEAVAAQPVIQDKAAAKPIEVSKKGTEIIIELGYNLSQLTAFHFIHVGTNTNGRSLDSTVFEGQAVRWLMTRRTKNSSYANLTLRQLATQVSKQYGLELDMEGDGPTYQFLDQTGITDYELLLREARAIGYSIFEKGKTLVMRPWRPEFTGFVITRDVLQKISFSDRASADRANTPGSASLSTPAVPAADAKAAVDRATGKVEQTKQEDSTGAGKKSAATVAVTGSAIPQMTGTPKPESAAPPAGKTDSTGKPVTTAPALDAPEPGKTEAKTTDGKPAKPTPAAEATAVATPGAAGDKIGLPRQEIGSIDLADGEAAAQEIKDESKRVKGWPGNATIITTPEALLLAPGSIIGIDEQVAPGIFSREWRVGSVKHVLQRGSFRTDIEFYTPQAAKNAQASPTPGATPTDSSGPTNAGGFAEPMKLEGNSSASEKTEWGYARGRLHNGLDYGGYGAGSDPDGVFASKDGVVVDAAEIGQAGGYGRLIIIRHADNWETWYAHLAKMDVGVGTQVKQGQRIGTRGSSGASGDGSFDTHLHYEIRKPDGNSVDPRTVLPKPGLRKAWLG